MYELKNHGTPEEPDRESGGKTDSVGENPAVDPSAENLDTQSKTVRVKPSEEKRIDRAAVFREKMKAAKKRRRRNIVLDILLVVFLATFVISGIYLLRYYLASRQNKELMGNLKEMIDTDIAPSPDTENKEGKDPNSQDPGHTPSSAQVPVYVTEDGETILRMYRPLYQKNKEFMGWLTIPDTNVDVPVMYTPNDEQKYLRKNFEGEYAIAGTPFIAEGCDPKKPSKNIIIYGHNMKDGSMFSDLLNYKDEEYYRFHKYIQFDTIYARGNYEVIAAFPGQVLNQGEEGFRYYYFYDTDNAEEFDTYVREVKSRCPYEIQTTAEFGDQLLTLSTCEDYGAAEGKRFVVVAKRIR